MSSMLPGVKLEQHMVLLDYVGRDASHALFQASEIEGRAPLKVLMPLRIYEDMCEQGGDEQVTIAIRRGNAFTDLDVAFQTPPGE